RNETVLRQLIRHDAIHSFPRPEDEPPACARQAPLRQNIMGCGESWRRRGRSVNFFPSVSYFTQGPILAHYGLLGPMSCFGESIAMTYRRILVGFAAAALLALPIQPGAQADTGTKIVEEVDFAVSCNPAVQQPFRHAVWTFHSFWYPQRLKAFTGVAEAEADCAMAYWGIAMSHWYPLWYPPTAASLKAGSEAIAKAMAASTKTEREKDYIAAIAAFYRDNDKLDHRTRALAYEKAMEQAYLKYPEDREAGVFYALALDTTAPPTDKTYANQKKAAEILNQVWKEQPNHPGVVHYLIHSDDSAQFAQAGLDAAICYAKIAPDVPHALHMPSHIFTRLGMWQESIDSNTAAENAALTYVQKALGPGGYDGNTVHAIGYLQYAHLQSAHGRAAKAGVGMV